MNTSVETILLIIFVACFPLFMDLTGSNIINQGKAKCVEIASVIKL